MSKWDVVAALGAAVFAGFAWWTAQRTYRGSFRPVLRPVPKRYPNGDIIPAFLVLKNIGRGPALSMFLVEPEPPPGERWRPTHPGPIVRTVDVVESLGAPCDGGGEETRIGRVEIVIPPARLLRQNTTYRLLYQDLTARWHETTFTIDDEQHDQFKVDWYQGGAGTSTNMNANEVFANVALELSGRQKGDYKVVEPHDHLNLSQSTNDSYPTALKVAFILRNDKLIAELRTSSRRSVPRLTSSSTS